MSDFYPAAQTGVSPLTAKATAAPAHAYKPAKAMSSGGSTDGPAQPEASSNGPWRKVVLVLVLLVFAALIVWRIRTGNAAQKSEADKATALANRATPVQVAAVEQKTVPVFLNALGTVTAYNTVTVNARVSGQLLRVNFREGQNVRKGELLMEIDPAPYKAAVDQAVGQLAKDQANLDNMKAEADRYTALYSAGVVSKEQRDLEVSNQGQAIGSIKADQAAIEAARVNLAYCRIYSPIDGVIGLRQVDPGNIVNAGQTTGLVVITQVHPIAVIFTLPEDQLPQVQKAMRGGSEPGGQALAVEAYDRADDHKIATGKLLTIDNQIDTTTGTAKLKAVFDNADNALFANQFVNVRLILSERPQAIVVPTAAISTGTQGDYVYLVKPGPGKARSRNGGGNAGGAGTQTPKGGGATGPDGQPRQLFHAETVPVHVDFTIGTASVLAAGALQPGQQVVVDGQEKLVDGGNVSVTQPAGRSGGRVAGGGAQPAGAQPGAAGATPAAAGATAPGGGHRHDHGVQGGGAQ